MTRGTWADDVQPTDPTGTVATPGPMRRATWSTTLTKTARATNVKSRRRWLAVMRAPKPVAEMTDAERNAFADELCERMLAGYERIVRDGDGGGR